MEKVFTIDSEKAVREIKQFLRRVAKREGYGKFVIGVSGGIDSATSLTLAALTFGEKALYPVLMPYGTLNDESTKDAWLVIHHLAIPQHQVTTVDIKPFIDTFCSYDGTIERMRLGNIMARARMMVLFDLVKKYNALVIGTENKSEHLLGYYTRFGDEASDMEPLRSLYKTQIFLLAKYLQIPGKILTKAPSAGLWESQTDEGEFGFSYKLADEVLYWHFEKGLSKEAIMKKGYTKAVVNSIWWWIEKGEFKARVPHVLKEG